MKARIIANYLPQFHPIPENDKYWGPGFTEWVNVVKAKPFFKGHYQPKIPADLGFYDLRLAEIREQQAQLARDAGVEGFCYWHYWFGNGKELLQRPFNEVLASGKPDFPFCLCWANHDWSTRSWKNGKGKDTIIQKQLYLGEDDYTLHFYNELPAFKDHRYITVDDKPLFVIYDPYHFPDVSNFIKVWRMLAKKEGLKGIYFVGMCNNTTTIKRDAEGKITHVIPNLKSSKDIYDSILSLGFDGINSWGKSRGEMIANGKYRRILRMYLNQKFSFLPALRYDYSKVAKHFFAPEDNWENVFPTIMPQWDRTARVGKHEGVYDNATPKEFQKHIEDAIKVIKNKQDEHKILFLRSWNEWGEGNYVEPDEKYGHGWLEAIKSAAK
jgi:lipopolysaccharide biosynthesis protein